MLGGEMSPKTRNKHDARANPPSAPDREKDIITSSLLFSPLIGRGWQSSEWPYKELRSEERERKQENQNYFEAHKSSQNKRDMKVK